jgi:ATP-dependent helicase/nuclease subunit A
VLDFADLVARAQALLARSQAAPWVLYKLDGGIDHILVDEGQDTSPEQWALIAPLTEEFFSGAGAREVARTMFAVGDPKQSIYSFQGAAPEQFLAESQTLSSRAHAAGAAFVAPSLDMSFRSAPQILAAVDATFDGVDLAGGRPGAFDVVRHVARRENEGGVVEVWPIAPRPQTPPHEPWDAPLDNDPGETAPAALARALARNVRDWIDAGERVWDHGALRPMRAGDVLALVRQRGVLFRALLRAFKREGLPVAGADRITLRDEIAVEDCLALMRVALDCSDDLSVACVLKGPWLNLTDEDRDLFPLAYERGEGETLHTRVMASADPRHRPAQALLAQLADHAGDDPFAFLTFVLDHVDETGASGWRRVFARLGREARDPLEEMLERALARRSDGAETLHRFLADIEHDDTPLKREMEEAGDAIRIMTVHGAKGLEAPVVLLPDTTGDIKDAPDSGVIHGEDGLYWSPSAREDDAATTRARAAYEEAALGEHWRLLYVAMTRARDRLIVAGYGQGQGAGAAHEMSWHTRVSAALAKIAASVETPFGEGLRLGAAPAPSPAHAPASAQIDLPAWARTPVAPPGERAQPRRASALAAMLSPRANEQTRFARGRLIHGLLERLPDVALPDRAEAAQAWLHRQGVDAEVAAALTREALAVIEAPDFAPLFGPESRAEAPIVGEIGARRVRGIVDRLVVTPHEVLIVDFKSDRAVPARAEDAPFPYVLQMALYAGVLAQIFPQRRVRTALIWTERPLLVELPEAMLAAARSAG